MKKIKIGIADDNREFCDILVDYFREKEDIELVFISHDGIKTIDYIDVYKRQGFTCLVNRLRIGLIILSSDPVSYTHLDVYKRQTSQRTE